MDKIITHEDLQHFTGTTQYFSHHLGIMYTDGIQYLAVNAQAYWLIDAIASYKRKERFQVWKFKVSDNKGVLTMVEDEGKPIKVKQNIKFTDFPLDEIEIWVVDGVMILPSEY